MAFTGDVIVRGGVPTLLSPDLVVSLFAQSRGGEPVRLQASASNAVAPDPAGGLQLGLNQALDAELPIASWAPRFPSGAYIWAFSASTICMAVSNA
ncbi:MAG: hypothetical protein DI533_04740 [Cereibacter sphaeroides]|uniref:Uncharacterized protein n=1 Tax=Cereibacter sphaeroides TaxID=1063 RepID=A0A2W5UQ81_CERSP|nr:MAG: hypothetical protein DI533_04740 [Cereibacter sphaeroides]